MDYEIQVGWEWLVAPDGHVLGIWVLIDGTRCEVIWVAGSFPWLPAGSQN